MRDDWTTSDHIVHDVFMMVMGFGMAAGEASDVADHSWAVLAILLAIALAAQIYGMFFRR
ncbi:MAG: hypothetical protein ABEN55_00465 [Bradymonadaceae bacterium]